MFGCNCIANNESNKLLLASFKKKKLLLAGKKIRRSEFVISLAADDFSQASNKFVGKVRQVLVNRNVDLPSILSAFHPTPYLLHNLIFIPTAGPIFGAPSSLYTTVNHQIMLQLNQIVVQAGYWILIKCHHEEVQHVAILLAPFPMMWSLIYHERSTASWTWYPSQLFMKGETLRLQHRHLQYLIYLFLVHQHWKKKSNDRFILCKPIRATRTEPKLYRALETHKHESHILGYTAWVSGTRLRGSY